MRCSSQASSGSDTISIDLCAIGLIFRMYLAHQVDDKNQEIRDLPLETLSHVIRVVNQRTFAMPAAMVLCAAMGF